MELKQLRVETPDLESLHGRTLNGHTTVLAIKENQLTVLENVGERNYTKICEGQ